MANTKITSLTELAETPNNNDVYPIVDISDTTMAASGTTKKILASRILHQSGGTANLSNVTVIGTNWTALTFNSGWGNVGGIHQIAQYKKIGDMVLLRGLVARTSGVDTVIGPLPSGYRPPSNIVLASIANNIIATIAIDPTSGNISLSSGTHTPWVNLTGLTFSTV